ncbi:MAG: hypothetical protein EHM37_07590, partial [Deltaproteobacteria bacterium]
MAIEPRIAVTSTFAGTGKCLNFGHPEARRWVTDCMSERITTLGVDVFRHDCNFGLARFWTHAEPPGRRGMNEIRYVEGLYAFWDELR